MNSRNQVKIRIYHSDIRRVSDRTIIKLLSNVSDLLKEVQYQEAFYIVNECELFGKYKEEVLRGIDFRLENSPNYYIDGVRRGSLEVTLSLTAIAIWVLDKTIGETIKEAWLRSDLNTWLINFLTTSKRRKAIERDIELVLENWSLDEFEVSSISFDSDEQDNLNVDITIDSKESRKYIHSVAQDDLDANFVLNRLQNKE